VVAETVAAAAAAWQRYVGSSQAAPVALRQQHTHTCRQQHD